MGISCSDLDLSFCDTQPAVAVGVSGGPDSMALAWLLRQWTASRNIHLHVLTVDHGLRAQSAEEARMVGDIVGAWPDTTHNILQWTGDKPQARLLEEARAMRYALMRDYCAAHDISHLFIAHHQDDQAETFLMRLAKGSGLDGLAAMKPLQPMGGITLVRPLLRISKGELIALCEENGIAFICDPTNEKTEYLRPRLRAARAALEAEGLTSKRLATTAMRLARARQALEDMAQSAYAASVRTGNGEEASFDARALGSYPEEIALRVILMAMDGVRASAGPYSPRLEKVEALVADMLAGRLDKTATLGGCLFVPDAKNGLLWVRREQ